MCLAFSKLLFLHIISHQHISSIHHEDFAIDKQITMSYCEYQYMQTSNEIFMYVSDIVRAVLIRSNQACRLPSDRNTT